MGPAMIGYAACMIELFILLAAAVNMETALWTFGIVHLGCALGTWTCVWWEKGAYKMTGIERG